MQAAAVQPRAYYPRLDGLRGLAIIGVLAEHLIRLDALSAWAPGMLGVKTFFTLSGFLITSILMRERETARSRSQVAASFAFRRCLRLWPAYYAAILLAATIGIAGMRENWWVHGAYLTNFAIALQGQWGGAGHFWTLAVEEQFYLLWFPLVVLAPRSWLAPTIVAALILGPLFRLPIALGASDFFAVLLPGQVDSFAAGALVAAAFHRPRLAWLDRLLTRREILWLLLLAVFCLSVPIPSSVFRPPLILSWVVLPVVVSAAAACLVRTCVRGGADMTCWLESPWLVRVGKISYGLYVYHYFILQIVTPERLGVGEMAQPLQTVVLAVTWIILSLVVAELSWRLMERPLLKLKNAPAAGRPTPATVRAGL